MDNFLGYTTHTHDIPIEVFLDFIQDDIKNVIRTHGHKNCGLSYEDVCKQIQTIITTKRTLILKLMNEHGQKKLNSEWRSEKNGFLNKLFKEEGFMNMCFPKKKYPNNKILNQLLSKHIQFCKEKDVKREALEKNPEYSACKQYNMWIDAQRKSFTQEYLINVRNFTSQTVEKYFSTKDHPGGHDPRGTYHKSKLNCTQYNTPPRSNPKIPVTEAPTNIVQSPMEPNNITGSQGKDGSSATYKVSGSAKTKPEENTPPNSKPHILDSQTSTPSKIQTGDTPVKTETPGSPVNRDGEKKESIPAQGQLPINRPPSAQAEVSPQTKGPPLPPEVTSPTHAIQSVPAATATTVKNTTSNQTPVTSSILTVTPVSSPNSGSPSTSNLFTPAADAKGQDKASQSSTTSETLPTTHPIQSVSSSAPADLSLPPLQAPVLTAPPVANTANEPGTPASTSASAITTTFRTTIATPATDTIPTMSITQAPIPSTKQAPSASHSQEDPHTPALSGPKTTEPNTESQQTAIHQPTSFSGRNNGGISFPTKADSPDGNEKITLPKNTPQQSKDSSLVSSTSLPEGAQPNGKPSITSTKFPPLTTIIPTIIIILAAITLLLQLYKYTPFGFLLGRRRKRRKRDLRSTFVIPEESTYESPNIALQEWENPNLLGQIVENDAYIKLLKINRYKQEMQKRKKKNKKTLIEVHIEVLEEHKNNEWELHKGDFLEICLRGFKNEENDNYSKLPNTELTAKSTKNDKIIEDIQKQDILWNNWVEDHRHILEKWKKEDWFQNLKNKWRNEEQKYKEKNDKLQDNILNKQETHSIVTQKEIWKQWISKQANLIDMFNKEDWFKELVYAQDKEKDNYHINEYNNVTVTTETQLKNEKRNHEYSRSKDIIQKLMVQIHMMVLEECIKEEIIKQKELCIHNFIEDIHNNNNYDEKRNIPLYEFCKKLKAIRGILINHLVSLRICAEKQEIILSVDNKRTESTSKNQKGESSQANTISASSFGKMIGVSQLSLFLYKITPLGSCLSPPLGNL
ncbi:STP1 protein [Plasmodium ovale wallikeri]|uniref:STP1 protein n=1 Tax=Plasmodium ovale wallikeri TaxID=864142 RepID=A0A1A9A8C5_PLAOA|nr:STP1 protein [Plasmodium ovale wallikeri]